MAMACYNTCFTLEEGGRAFLVDVGCGCQIFERLKMAKID